MEEFKTLVSNSTNKIDIEKIVSDAKRKNEDMKKLSEKKEEALKEINNLVSFGEIASEYANRIKESYSIEELESILQEAQSKNNLMQSESKPNSPSNNNASTIAIGICVPLAIVIIAVIVSIVVIRRKNKYNKVSDSDEMQE